MRTRPLNNFLPCLTLSLLSISLAFSPLAISSNYRHHWARPPSSPCHSKSFKQLSAGSQDSDSQDLGLNELQTLLRDAVRREDFDEASQLSGQLMGRLHPNDMPQTEEELHYRRKHMSWQGIGAIQWLVDRLESLNFTLPTTIQINTMEAVNDILNATDEVLEKSTLEERVEFNDQDMGIVVSGSTGSGKTLAFLVPLLSTLSESLFQRQRIRVGAEANVGDTTGDLLDRLTIVTTPVVRSSSQHPGAVPMNIPLATLGKSTSDVEKPLALIVVPTRELGVQTSTILYGLVGGSVKEDPTDIQGSANRFQYKGPKGVRISCVLSDEESEMGMPMQTDVAVTMPEYLGKLIADGDLVPSHLRVIIYDEADLALEQTSAADLTAVFEDDLKERQLSRLSFLVGASVTESLGNLAVRSRMLPEGKSYIATATRHAPLQMGAKLDKEPAWTSSQPKEASLTDLGVVLDPGLRHQRVRVADGSGLLVLTRLVRQALEEGAQHEDENHHRPRVVVFFPNEELAKAAIVPLRDALWGKHKVCVLLPTIGVNPLTMMEQFKNNQTTLMLATPNSVRGLDFPAVSHVYTLYLPMDDPREYVHLAGRVGRVGQEGSARGGGGQVISVLREEEASKMDRLAETLGFEFIDIEAEGEAYVPPEMTDDEDEIDLGDADLDALRRQLEDAVTLLNHTKKNIEQES